MSINIYDGSELKRVDGVNVAKYIPYDNGSSNLESNTVQNAIDEVDNNIQSKIGQEDILTTIEEVEASTNTDDVVGSGVVKEISNSLSTSKSTVLNVTGVNVEHGVDTTIYTSEALSGIYAINGFVSFGTATSVGDKVVSIVVGGTTEFQSAIVTEKGTVLPISSVTRLDNHSFTVHVKQNNSNNSLKISARILLTKIKDI